MTKCNRCLKTFKDIDGYHSCTPAVYKSHCCESRVYVVAGNKRYLDIQEQDVERGKTYHYQCVECEKACDAIGL